MADRPNRPAFIPPSQLDPPAAAPSATPSKASNPATGVPPWEITAAHRRDRTIELLTEANANIVALNYRLLSMQTTLGWILLLMLVAVLSPCALAGLLFLGLGAAGSAAADRAQQRIEVRAGR